MEKAKCDSCSSLRYCIQRDAVTQCLACALGDLSAILGAIAADLKALKEAVPRHVGARGDMSSPRRCAICKKDAAALGLPHWEDMCAICIAETIGKLLEFLRTGLKTIMQTCAHCSQPAVYLWAGWVPLCECCAVSAWLAVLQEAGPRGEARLTPSSHTPGESPAAAQV